MSNNALGSLVASKTISIVPQNGTEFEVTKGQKVIFEIDASMGLVKGRDSMLALDILNASPDYKRLALNGTAGCDGLISRVDIYSRTSGVHLETMDHYNQVMAIANQYYFEDKANLQSLQGCGKKVFAQEYDATAADVVPVEPSVTNVEDAQLSPIANQGGTDDAKAVYNFRRYMSPLKCGVFRYWDDERLCPVAALGGLRIEITLEDPKICSHYMNGQQVDGTKIDIVDQSGDGLPIQDNSAGANIDSTNDQTVQYSGFAIGNQVVVNYVDNAGAPQTHNSTIVGLSRAANKLRTTLADAVPAGNKTAVKMFLRGETRALRVRPQLRVVSVAPTADLIKEMSKGINYSFTSYDYFVDMIMSTARRHLVEINSVATKAVALWTSFNSTAESSSLFSNYFSGFDANEMNFSEYQYFLKGRLVPVRAVDPREFREKIIAQHEFAKALNSVNIEPKDLGNTDGKNIEQYTNRFCIGRELAKRGYYYSLRDSEGQLRLGFANDLPTNTETNTYVWSIRVINVDPQTGQVSVIL